MTILHYNLHTRAAKDRVPVGSEDLGPLFSRWSALAFHLFPPAGKRVALKLAITMAGRHRPAMVKDFESLHRKDAYQLPAAVNCVTRHSDNWRRLPREKTENAGANNTLLFRLNSYVQYVDYSTFEYCTTVKDETLATMEQYGVQSLT